MRISTKMVFYFSIAVFLIVFCEKKSPDLKFSQFNQKFFAKYVPEFPGARLLTKNDLPQNQQQYFDEADGKLQLLIDINQNGIPEYIICGVSDSMLYHQQKGAYFLAIFEQTENGIEKRYLQKLALIPVNILPSENKERPGVILSFAFSSDYAAEIYFEDNEYKLEKWF